MLRIRLTRTGKKSQPSYRIVVAEHSAPVKSKFVEILGHYNLSQAPRQLVVDQDRIKYWISVGAKPSDSVAVLLKNLGMADMEKYIVKPRDLKRKKRNAPEEEAAPAPKATVTEEAPAEEAPAEEAPAEEAPAEEAPAEEAAAEEAPAEEAPAEEAPAEEETPKEDSAE